MANDRHFTSLGFTAERFPAGTHMCFIYNNEEERRAVMAGYIESGFKEGDLTFYLVHKTTPQEFSAHLADYGITLPASLKPDQWVLKSAQETYTPDRTFIPDRMLETLKAFYQSGIKAGFKGVRGMGEMEWALEGMPGSDGLIEYEARINTVVAEYPLTAICQYDARKFDGATLFDVLNVHPMMVVRGQVVRNPYYLPPDEFFRRRQGT